MLRVEKLLVIIWMYELKARFVRIESQPRGERCSVWNFFFVDLKVQFGVESSNREFLKAQNRTK